MSECKCCHKALIISPTPVNGLPTTTFSPPSKRAAYSAIIVLVSRLTNLFRDL